MTQPSQQPPDPRTHPRTDEDLLRAFTRAGPGAREALGELAQRHEAHLLGLAQGLLDGDREGALEAVQEAWVRLIRYGAGFKGTSTVRTWLYRIVINRCIEARARRQRDTHRNGALHAAPPLVPDATTPEPTAMRTAINTLSADQRLILLLCYHRGLTHQQAADVLAIPLGTLKSRQHAAIQQLRTALAPEAIT